MFADVRPRAPDLCFSQPRMKLGPGNEPSVSRKSHFEYFISFATSIFADLHQASYCAASEKLLLYVRVHRSLGGVPAQPGGCHCFVWGWTSLWRHQAVVLLGYVTGTSPMAGMLCTGWPRALLQGHTCCFSSYAAKLPFFQEASGGLFILFT